MGERADILIVFKYSDGKYDVIVLHTHWMGFTFDEDFKKIMMLARAFILDEEHLLASPNIVVWYLMFIDGLKCLKINNEFMEKFGVVFPCIPDVTLRLDIRDTDGYSYIVVMPDYDEILGKKLRGVLKHIPYRIIKLEIGYKGFSDEDLELIRKGELDKVLNKYKVVKDEIFLLPADLMSADKG